MLSRANIYKRLNELHDEIKDIEIQKMLLADDVPCRQRSYYWFKNEKERLQWRIDMRNREIKQLESWLIRDLNPRTLHLTVVFEEDLNYDKILENGIRGIKF